MRQEYPGIGGITGKPRAQRFVRGGMLHRRHWLLTWAGVVLLVIVALAGCASTPAGGASSTSTSSTGQGGTPGATSQATATGPTNVQITDLASFRNQLSAAFSKNTWAKVVPFLSPDFSFQGLNSGGNRLVMPDSGVDFSKLYQAQGPWSQASQYEVNIHFCDAGLTPADQQMGFDGGGGSFILVGILRWQGGWLVGWAFQDPLGGSDACAVG